MTVASHNQSRIRGAMALSVSQAVVLLLGYVTHVIIGRLLGPSQYGVYGIVLSIQTILGLFLTLGVPIAVSRYVAQDQENARAILKQGLKIQTFIAASLACIIILFAPVISSLLRDSTLTPYIMFVAAVLFFQAYYPIFSQYLSGMHMFSKQAFLTNLYACAKLAGALTLMYVFFNLYGALAGFAVGGIAAAVAGFVFTQKIGNHTHKKLSLRSFLSFAGTYVLILVGLQILMSIDLFMVKSIIGDNQQAGYYNAAVTLSRIPYFLLQGLMFVILPSVSQLTKHSASSRKAAQFIRDTLRYLIALIVPSVTFAAATSKNLVILFFSRDFIASAPILTILMLGLGALAFYLLIANIVAGAGKAHIGLVVTVVLVLISSVLGYALIPRWGLIGAAWQTAITSGIGLVTLSAYTFYSFRIPFPIKSTLNVVIATAAAVIPTYLWSPQPFVLPLQFVLLFVVYGAMLFLLGEISDEDRMRIASIHKSLSWIAPA